MPGHTLSHTPVRMRARTHRVPLVMALCTPSPVLQPKPRSDSPGHPRCPRTTACSWYSLQRSLCLGCCPSALQPLQSHRASMGIWLAKCLPGTGPDSTMATVPAQGQHPPCPVEAMPVEREAAWQHETGLLVRGWRHRDCVHPCCLGRQVGPEHGVEALGAPCQLGCPLRCSPGLGTCVPGKGPAEGSLSARPGLH